jgi:hypothetical protein
MHHHQGLREGSNGYSFLLERFGYGLVLTSPNSEAVVPVEGVVLVVSLLWSLLAGVPLMVALLGS